MLGFLFATLLSVAVANAAPIFMYSNSDVLAGRNHYVPSTPTLFTSDPTQPLLPPSLFSPTIPTSILSIVLLTDASPDTFATTNNWLKEEYVGAQSSIVVPQFERDIEHDLSLRQDILRYDDTNYNNLQQIVTKALTPETTALVIKVKSLQDSASTFKTLIQFLELKHQVVVVITSTSETQATKLDVDLALQQGMPASAEMLIKENEISSASLHPGSRRILEDVAVGAGPEIIIGVRNSPGIMGGLIAGVFLLFTLWIAVMCLASVDSYPMMVNAPPGPKEGDPQFIGTAKEGTRYYPYMNQPVKEM